LLRAIINKNKKLDNLVNSTRELWLIYLKNTALASHSLYELFKQLAFGVPIKNKFSRKILFFV
jgi:hypothetical protein